MTNNGSDLISETLSNDTTVSLLNSVYFLPLKIGLFLINILFNGFIIINVVFIIKNNTFSNLMFVSTSIADFLIGLISIPFQIYTNHYKVWKLNHIVCHIWFVNDYSSGSISIYSLLYLSIHRFFQLKTPLKSTEKVNRKRKIGIIMIWLLNYLFWTIGVSLRTFSDELNTCYDGKEPFYKVLIEETIGYILPIVGVFVFNGLLFYQIVERNRTRQKWGFKAKDGNKGPVENIHSLKVVQKSVSKRKQVADSNENEINTETWTHRIKIFTVVNHLNNSKVIIKRKTKLCIKKKKILFCLPYPRNHLLRSLLCISAVTISLFLLFIVFLFVWPISSYCNNGCISDNLYNISYWLTYIYSSLNPLILIIFHSNFRRQFKRMISNIFNI
jgi:histamine receptor H3